MRPAARIRRVAATGLAIAALLALCPRPAAAHDAPYSFLNLRFAPGGVSGTLTAHVVDLAHEFPVAAPESLLTSSRASALTEPTCASASAARPRTCRR